MYRGHDGALSGRQVHRLAPTRRGLFIFVYTFPFIYFSGTYYLLRQQLLTLNCDTDPGFCVIRLLHPPRLRRPRF